MEKADKFSSLSQTDQKKIFCARKIVCWSHLMTKIPSIYKVCLIYVYVAPSP